MGAGNVKAVYETWSSLPDRQFRVLAYMALVSKDGDAVPTYWGGWKALAGAIGRGGHEQLTAAEARAAKEAVRVALKALTKAGAIDVSRSSAPGRNATYEIHLPATGQTNPVVNNPTGQTNPVPNRPDEPCTEPINGPDLPRQRARLTPATGQTNPVPEEHKEEEEQAAAAREPGHPTGRGVNNADTPGHPPTVAPAGDGVCSTDPIPADQRQAVAELIARHGPALDEATALAAVAAIAAKAKAPIRTWSGYTSRFTLADLQEKARTWSEATPAPAIPECSHGVTGGERILGRGDQASRRCGKCESERPAVTDLEVAS